jgi:hypothetical protein
MEHFKSSACPSTGEWDSEEGWIAAEPLFRRKPFLRTKLNLSLSDVQKAIGSHACGFPREVEFDEGRLYSVTPAEVFGPNSERALRVAWRFRNIHDARDGTSRLRSNATCKRRRLTSEDAERMPYFIARHGRIHDMPRILRGGKLIAGCADSVKFKHRQNPDDVDPEFVYFDLFEPNARYTRCSRKTRESATLSWVLNLNHMLRDGVQVMLPRPMALGCLYYVIRDI